MFIKHISECVDACYNELKDSKNDRIRKNVRKIEKEITEENATYMRFVVLKTIIGLCEDEVSDENENDYIIEALQQAEKDLKLMKTSYTFRIELKRQEDNIYRVMKVPASTGLADFAYMILATFQADASHLFDFTINKENYGCFTEGYSDDDVLDDYYLSDFKLRKKSKFNFCYDLGDCFDFTITLINVEVLKMNAILEDNIIIDGKGYGIWEDAHYELDMYYYNRKEFKKFVLGNGMEEEDYPIHEKFDLNENNKEMKQRISRIKVAYESKRLC